MKDVFSRCFSLSLSLSLSLLHVKKGVSISRSLITIRILDTMYFEPISRFRFDTQEYGGIDRRSLVVIGASFVEFRYLIRPSRGKSWQENLACKYFPLIVAAICFVLEMSSKRLHNKQTNVYADRERNGNLATTRHSSSPDVCFSFGNQWPYILRRFVIRRARLSAD